jgi:hypothetical protein
MLACTAGSCQSAGSVPSLPPHSGGGQRHVAAGEAAAAVASSSVAAKDSLKAATQAAGVEAPLSSPVLALSSCRAASRSSTACTNTGIIALFTTIFTLYIYKWLPI